MKLFEQGLTAGKPDPDFGHVFDAEGKAIPKWSEEFHRLLLKHSFLVVRNVELQHPDQLGEYGRTMGEPLRYAFGKIFELKDMGSTPNGRTQLSNRAMSIHQDSVLPAAFADVIMMYCWSAPRTGGEALICDNRKFMAVLRSRFPDLHEFFINTLVKYKNHTDDYYSDKGVAQDWIVKPTVRKHPLLDITLPYFALNDFNDPLRNFTAMFDKLSEEESDQKMRQLDAIMRSPEVMVTYAIQPGDVLIYDNLLVSHGRNAFDNTGEPRHLSRVQVQLR